MENKSETLCREIMCGSVDRKRSAEYTLPHWYPSLESRGRPFFGHGGANDGFRCKMLAHRTGGFGVVILTNSDNGRLLSEVIVPLIGRVEGWPGY